VSDAIISTDLNFHIKSWNAAAEHLYGWKEKEVIGKFVGDVTRLTYPNDNQEEVVKQFLKEGYWEGETLQKTRDGKTLMIYSTVRLVKDSQGNPEEVVAVNRDITERKQVEKVLQYRLDFEQLVSRISTSFINCPVEEIDKKINHALKSIAEFVGAVRSSVFLFSDDLTMVSNTHEWCADSADSQIDLLQKFPFDQFGTYCTTLKRLETVVVGRPADMPSEAQSEREWSETYGFRSLLFVPMILEGTLYGTLGFYGQVGEERDWPEDFVLLLKFVADILVNALERKRTEKALRKSEEKLRVLFEGTHDLITLTDANATTLWANPAWKNVFGEDITRREDPFKLIHPDDLDNAAQAWNALVTKKEAIVNLVYRFKGKNGEYRFFESSAFPVTIGGEPLFYVVARDITEHKRTEEALQESEERYKFLLESIVDSVYILDPEWRHVVVNDAAERFVQIPKETLLENRLTDLFPGIEQTEFFRVFQRVMETRESDTVINRGWTEGMV